ncbi:MAG: PAS domain S-box protein [Deltaproteobacteria bacterium]|nr:PAS domain S-box protein [Deltaproteobacteria bacterium]
MFEKILFYIILLLTVLFSAYSAFVHNLDYRIAGTSFFALITLLVFSRNSRLKKEIKKRKQTEKELKDSEELFRKAFENANTGVYLAGVDGSFLKVNQRMSDITGFSKDELEKQKINNITYPLDSHLSTEFINSSITGKKKNIVFEKRFIHKKGDIIWGQVSSSLVKDSFGKPLYFISNLQDITKQKDIESFYRDLFLKAPFAYQSLDSDGNFIEINKEWLSMMGYSRDEIIGKWFGNFINDEGNKRYFTDNFMCFKKDGKISVEFDLIKKNKQIINAQFKGKIGVNNDGSFRQTHCILKDNTEKKRLEEEKKKLEAQIRQSHKMESIGTLTGGIAHDFNNILSIVIGNTELALLDIPESNPSYDNIRTIKDAGLRASEIVKQLLNFSRKTDQILKNIEIDIVLKKSLKLLRSTIPATIEIEEDIRGQNICILGDITQINQILMNLCINSSKSIGNDSGQIIVSLEEMVLNRKDVLALPDLKPGKHVQIQVRDNGNGIESSIIERIFDPYFTTSEIGKGTGMGLSVVLGIVKNHDGAITVESQKGEGATFKVYFPATMGNTYQIPKLEDMTLTGSESILFVDDEISITEMSKKTLERLGYSVDTVDNPVDALENFKLNPGDYDLVITDMAMPKINGLDFTKEIRDIRNDIPVIICSGFNTSINEDNIDEHSISAYLSKPVITSELAKTIREVLD